jgi:hypothetical protein
MPIFLTLVITLVFIYLVFFGRKQTKQVVNSQGKWTSSSQLTVRDTSSANPLTHLSLEQTLAIVHWPDKRQVVLDDLTALNANQFQFY